MMQLARMPFPLRSRTAYQPLPKNVAAATDKHPSLAGRD